MSRSPADERLLALLDEYGHVLRRAIRRVAPRSLDRDLEDIEQEARVRLWRAMQKRELDRPASYLYRVAVNAAVDALQRHKARREEGLDSIGGQEPGSDLASPERTAMGRQIVGSVRRAMGRLLPDRRRAVGLHLQGFTTSEIAELYGWTEPKARNLAYRGLGDLRSRLKEEQEHREYAEATG